MNTNGLAARELEALERRLFEIAGSMRNFADVADRCVITEVVNAPPSIRTWATMLDELHSDITSLRSQLGQGAGEPVAFVDITPDGIGFSCAAHRSVRKLLGEGRHPLFTHPVQSVEVTDAKVKIALEAHADEMERQDRDESLPLKDRLHECMRAALISVMGNKDG